MIHLRPFKAIRPASGKEAQIAALPYDVYSSAEAREAVKDRPLSFLRIDRAETQLPEGTDIYSDDVYAKAKELLWDMVDRGDFVRDEEPSFYVYEETMRGRSQTGLVACASIDDYLEGRIKKHEDTRRGKEEDRVRHVDFCGAQTGPIFLAYKNSRKIKELILAAKEGEPIFSFTSKDGIRHRGWRTSDGELCRMIRLAFEEVDALYIADGHHRAASAVRVGQMRRKKNPGYTGDEEFNFFLSAIFPDDELKILDYNRVVRDLNGLSNQEFLNAVGKVCAIETLPSLKAPGLKGEMTLILGDDGTGQTGSGTAYYRLRIRRKYRNTDPVEGLDVSILQKEVLDPILGITDPTEDGRIGFVGGIRGLGELKRRVDTDMRAAFAMYPTSMEELIAVADAGRLMPPKSTWFEPKLYSGLFIHAI